MRIRPRAVLARRLVASTAALTSVATFAGFLAPVSSGALWQVAVPEASAQAPLSGTNCSAALSGTALDRTGWLASTNAPSSSSDAPQNALDGNLATRFSTDETQRPGLYFEVNMGSAQTFDELDMEVPNSPTDYAASYEVEVSDNGTTWTTVATCTGTATPEVVSFPQQTAQYVLVMLTGTSNYWWSIDEFNLLTSSSGGNCFATASGTALNRSGWVASTNAPSSSSDAPQNALDGNLATRFSTDETQRPGLYFEVNMGSVQTFDELDMEVPNSPTDYARDYQVEASSNGSTWATVANCFGTGPSEVVSFPPQAAQYVLVMLTGTSDTYWWSIDEFNLYTQSVPSTTTTTTTTTTTVPTTTTTTAPMPPPPPTRLHFPPPPPPRRHFRVFCVVWGWGWIHMWRHRFVRVRVCFRLRFFPFPVHFPRPLPPLVVAFAHGHGHGHDFGDRPGPWGRGDRDRD